MTQRRDPGSRALAAWWRFWFTPALPTDLGVCRLLFFGLLALFYLPHDFSGWGNVSEAYWLPIWLFDRLHIPPLSTGALHGLQIVWKISMALAAIGLFARVSMAVAAVLGTYLLGLGHNYGQIYHFDAILVLAFWILAFSRAGDSWSVDALRLAARGRPRPVAPHSEYRWPIQLILVALSFVFFAAGVAKLWTSGFEWVASEHLAILLDRVQYNISDADPLTTWGSYIARRPWMATMVALGTITVEFFYPVALFSRILRIPMVLGGIGLVVGIRMLMGPTFEHFLLINVFWVPWHQVGEWVLARSQRRAPRPNVHVMYDGACGICRPTVAVLRRLDLFHRVTFMDAVNEWPAIHSRFPSLDAARCLNDMHVVAAGGRVFVGYDGYRALARVLPLGWVFLPLLYVPPVPFIGRRVYRLIADNRPRSCVIAPADRSSGSNLPFRPDERVTDSAG
jgi:predicted DCC family thiol-disulfide oxidoreductase YuxK